MILIVEDDQDTREALELIIKHMRIDCVSASGTYDGDDLMCKTKPDVLLIDLYLGHNDDAARLIDRCRDNSPLTRIVLMSAMNPERLNQAAKQLHVDCTLSKPFTIDELENVLHSCQKH